MSSTTSSSTPTNSRSSSGYTDELGMHDMSDPEPRPGDDEGVAAEPSRAAGQGRPRRRCVDAASAPSAGRASAADATRRVHRHAARDHPRRRVAAGRRAAGREGPRLQVQRPADEHECPGAEVDHRAGQLRHPRRLQLPVLPDLADRQLPARRPDEDQGLEPVLPGVHEGQGPAGPQELHRRPGQRAVPRHVRRPGRPAPACRRRRKGRAPTSRSSSGGTTTTNKAIGGKPQPQLDPRAAGPLQHGLDGLQRRRDQEGARRRSRGRSS